MIKPDVLPVDLNHTLLESFPEKRPDGPMVMVAPHEMHLPAMDPIPIPGRRIEPPLAEIPQDPQDITDPD
jgi:hypothetical protein